MLYVIAQKRNATLQCLIHCPPFQKYFIQNTYKQHIQAETKGLTNSFAKIVQKLSNNQNESTSEFKKCLSKTFIKPFTVTNFKDPIKKMQSLIQDLNVFTFFFRGNGKGVKQSFKKAKILRAKSRYYQKFTLRNRNYHIQSDTWWNYFLSHEDSIIQDLFTGQFLNTVTCMNCDHVSIGFDNFQEVSVAFTQGLRKLETFTLDRMLHAFIKEEIVNSEIRCEKCKKQNKFKKKLDFYKTPQILIIHIKRFKFGSYIKEKLTQAVRFGQTLDLNPYIQNTINKNQFDKSNQNTTYELFGIVNHSGSLNGGHYTSEVKVLDKWYNFNDSIVSKVDNYKIDQYQAQGGTNPYVLYYKKVEGSSIRLSNL